MEARNALYSKESETTSDQLGLLSKQLEWVRKSIGMWKQRYKIATEDYEKTDLRDWSKANEALLNEIETDEQSLNARLTDIRKQLTDLQQETQPGNDTPAEVLNLLKARQAILRTHVDAITDHGARMDSVRRLGTELTKDIDSNRLTFNLKEWAESAWEGVLSVWNYISYRISW